MRNRLINLAIHYQGEYDLMRRALVENRPVPSANTSSQVLCIGDKGYPNCLYQLKNPPFVIFYEGDIRLLERPMVAVIGSRQPSVYGISQTRQLVRKLKASQVIVSGLAKGIDAIAHREAFDHQTIGILGCGLNVVYPYENKDLINQMKKQQLVISEYPIDARPKKHHFPFRNRLIAAFASTIYVMAASPKSGTMTTVNEALNLNRRVVVLPYRITDPHGQGCNQLIEEGAEILR